MKQTYQTGLDGESAAEKWLCENYGMTCLERRYKSKVGEIDLIMSDRGTIAFIEVKTRMNAEPGNGLLAVNRSKQLRISNAARFYLMKSGRLNAACRFDVVEICRGEILYVPNAFQPGGMFFG